MDLMTAEQAGQFLQSQANHQSGALANGDISHGHHTQATHNGHQVAAGLAQVQSKRKNLKIFTEETQSLQDHSCSNKCSVVTAVAQLLLCSMLYLHSPKCATSSESGLQTAVQVRVHRGNQSVKKVLPWQQQCLMHVMQSMSLAWST